MRPTRCGRWTIGSTRRVTLTRRVHGRLVYASGRIAFTEAKQGAEVVRKCDVIGEVSPVFGKMLNEQGAMLGLVGRVVTVEVADGQSRCRAGLIDVVVVVDDGTAERVAVLV